LETITIHRNKENTKNPSNCTTFQATIHLPGNETEKKSICDPCWLLENSATFFSVVVMVAYLMQITRRKYFQAFCLKEILREKY